jgi:histidinol dehydrogenase
MRVLQGKDALREVGNLVTRSATIRPESERVAAKIIRDVRRSGERALRRYSEKFDGLKKGQPFLVSQEEMQDALRSVSPEFLKALKTAAGNIRRFAQWQLPKSWTRTMQPGVEVGQRVVPIMYVGCYVPGGRHPLPSSLLMTVIPAQVAGVPVISVASPNPAPETLAAAALLGVKHFYRIGGAQAIAAFAYGGGIPPVAKIVGPGNSYVTAAKKLVSFDCAIDMLAGPTEIIYLAEAGDPQFIASDLVAQAEHDPETLPIFITCDKKLARDVARTAMSMARANPVALKSLAENGLALVAHEHEEALGWANAIGAEHITVSRADAESVSSAGSIFVGPYSPQSLGDYASGPNHVLPTANVAKFRGGLSVLDFVKIITVQEVSRAGLKKIGPTVTTLAEAEGLSAHAESVRVRCR